MHHKKLIPGFVCRDGKTFSLLGHPFCDSAEELGLFSGSTGADALLFADGSRTDEDHEAVIGALRKTVRAADIPVLAGGRVRRLEDVKKYLYAGAESVFLDAAEESNVDLLKEASDRFGSERIGICLPDPSYESRLEEYAQLGASYAILLSPGPLSKADSLPIPVFPMLRQESEEAAAAMLKAPSCGGLILTEGWGRESGAGSCMEWKHRLKRHQAEGEDLFESTLSWDAFHPGPGGLIPVIVQDYKTAEVLMLAYMNQEAFQKTLDTGKMTYYSRSRQCLWVKGETSGHTQYVKSLHLDCDNDTLLAKVHQIGAACHTGSRSCFYCVVDGDAHCLAEYGSWHCGSGSAVAGNGAGIPIWARSNHAAYLRTGRFAFFLFCLYHIAWVGLEVRYCCGSFGCSRFGDWRQAP